MGRCRDHGGLRQQGLVEQDRWPAPPPSSSPGTTPPALASTMADPAFRDAVTTAVRTTPVVLADGAMTAVLGRAGRRRRTHPRPTSTRSRRRASPPSARTMPRGSPGWAWWQPRWCRTSPTTTGGVGCTPVSRGAAAARHRHRRRLGRGAGALGGVGRRSFRRRGRRSAGRPVDRRERCDGFQRSRARRLRRRRAAAALSQLGVGRRPPRDAVSGGRRHAGSAPGGGGDAGSARPLRGAPARATVGVWGPPIPTTTDAVSLDAPGEPRRRDTLAIGGSRDGPSTSRRRGRRVPTVHGRGHAGRAGGERTGLHAARAARLRARPAHARVRRAVRRVGDGVQPRQAARGRRGGAGPRGRPLPRGDHRHP